MHRRRGNPFGNFPSVFSLLSQGSLALEVLVITLVTSVLLVGELELRRPRALWVSFPASLPARGLLSRVRLREAGDCLWQISVPLYFSLFPLQPFSLLTSWVGTGPREGGGQLPLPWAPTACPED